jgi:DNA-binding CsgD family transcriptional regulator
MFTPLEHRIVNLITQGNKNQEIAVICGTTELVIKNYVRRIFDKTGMSSRLQLALWYTKRQFEESIRDVRRRLRWPRHPGARLVAASDRSDGQTEQGLSRPDSSTHNAPKQLES